MFIIFINYTQFLYLFLHSSEVFSLHPISQLMIYPLLCQSDSHSDSISLNHTKMNLSVTKLQTYSFEDPLTKTFFTLWCMTSVKYSHVNYSGVFNLKFLEISNRLAMLTLSTECKWFLQTTQTTQM